MKKDQKNRNGKNNFFTKKGLALFLLIFSTILLSYGAIVLGAMYRVGTEIHADGGYGAVCGEPDELGLRHSCWKKI